MEVDHELTVAARIKGWRLFDPNWPYLGEHDCLSVRSLVAMSVGLHPYFADESWLFCVALRYFRGEGVPDTNLDDSLPPEGEAGAVRIDTFLRRLSVAMSGATLGALRVAAIGNAGPECTPAEFVRFAEAKAWGLPAEFPRPSQAATQHAPIPRPLQRQAAQEEAILATLAELGFDPSALPAAPRGKASPAKQPVRSKLGYSADVMNKAWRRLRKDKKIKNA